MQQGSRQGPAEFLSGLDRFAGSDINGPMEKIRSFLKQNKMLQSDFARLVGLSPQFINDLLRGRSRCGVYSARKIQRYTGGQIRAADLVLAEKGQ